MKKQLGFTLIELMIVVAIVGILAAVAWPAYQNQVRSSNRADAEGALMGFAQAMERHFTEKGTYKGAADGGGDTGSPGVFAPQVPLDGSNKFYDLKIISADASSYTLQAQPIGGGVQANDGKLQLDSSGEKAWDRGNDGSFDDPGDLCWKTTCS
ncbi:type IV pilin protein [Microbulbifer sp. SAOS-129_SWC]|uniref:type IV pilin protein n=1 Tax=Microbulbifer sp. SAOS-129_SWC TaxID=3145235 RepID=UPI003217C7C6